MKMLIAVFALSLITIGNSCNDKKNNHVLNLYKGKNSFTGFNAKLLKEDSLKLEKMLASYNWAKANPENSKRMVFAKSFVQMVEVNERLSDYKIYDYQYCEATKTDTGLVIVFKQYAPYSGAMLFEGINLEFIIRENAFKTSISHWSDTGMRPESKVYYDKLTLWGKNFEKGDTISGRIHVLAIPKKNWRQIFKGNFNAIIR